MSQKEFLTFTEFLLEKNNLGTLPLKAPVAKQDVLQEFTPTKPVTKTSVPLSVPTALSLSNLNQPTEKAPTSKLQATIGKPNAKTGKVKDYFIPHEGNGYHPHALHPQRLAFHATSAVVIKIVTLLILVSFPVEAWLAPEELTAQNQQIIKYTNQIRRESNLNELKVSQRLNQASYLKAQDMLIKQYFAHISPDKVGLSNWLAMAEYPYAVAGENLAMGFTSAADVMLGWRQSPTHYANLIDPEFKEIGVSSVAGAYQDTDTTFVAQFFAKPDPGVMAAAKSTTPEVKAKKLMGKVIVAAARPETFTSVTANIEPVEQVLGIKATEIPSTPVEPQLTPDGQPRVSLFINQPQTGKLLIQSEAFVPKDTTKAQISVKGRTIDLELINPNSGLWGTNQLIYTEKPDPAEAVVPAVITVWDKDGNKTSTDINASNLKPTATTYVKQYQYAKSHQPGVTSSIISFTSSYYLVLLLLAMVALTFNIFVAFNKQHPRLIASTIGFMSLIALLILL
ncbi:CAP domain-containing protein [Candidatus Falkowbacteria bacterium]|nr:CAP domain-containing protein [Candidatus Falkowbacteria bacterium]